MVSPANGTLPLVPLNDASVVIVDVAGLNLKTVPRSFAPPRIVTP